MRIVISGCIALFLASLTVGAQEFFQDSDWRTYENLSDAEVALKSSAEDDVIAGALTYFFEGRMRKDAELVKTAMNSLKKLQRKKRNDPKILVFYGMVSLGYAGESKSLGSKIVGSNAGLSSLRRAKKFGADNLELYYVYLVCTWEVPRKYINLSKEMIEFSEGWFSRYKGDISGAPESVNARLRSYDAIVRLVRAEVERREGNTALAGSFFRQVKLPLIESLTGAERVVGLYKSLDRSL